MGTTIIESSREACEQQAAEIIASKLNNMANKDHVVFGICGGRSVENIFHLLTEKDIPWKKVQIFMVDERCVSLNSLQSNYRLAYENLIKSLVEQKKLPEENVHPYVYEEKNTVASLRHYNNALKEKGGKFDIILASAGEDGHVAALYPKHRSITNETREFFVMKDSPKPPKERMTASLKLLQTSSIGILLFFGKEKDSAFSKFQDPTINVQDCPAKLINQLPESWVFHTIEK